MTTTNPLRLTTLAEVQRLCRLVKSYNLNPLEKYDEADVKIMMTCTDTTGYSEHFFIKTNNLSHYLVLLNNQFHLYKLLDSSFTVKTHEDKLLETAMQQEAGCKAIVEHFNHQIL